MEEKCTETIYPSGTYGSFKGCRCGRPAKEDGKCKIHCKSTKEKRQKLANAKFEACMAPIREKERKLKAYPILVEALQRIYKEVYENQIAAKALREIGELK